MQLSIRMRKQRGFTLSEAMISLSVLTSGLFALAQFQGEIHESGRWAKTRTEAANLAQQKLEELRYQATLDYAGIADGSDRPSTEDGAGTAFRRRWTVTPRKDPELKEIDVYTEWSTRDGGIESVGLSSILTPARPYPAGSGPAQPALPQSDTEQFEQQGSALALEPVQSAHSATCLCTLSHGDGSVAVDPRSDHASCSKSCCASSQPETTPCSRDTCTFVARCGTI
ncbi:type IV pilus modification PilV family protein [Thiorhodococcus minor]|uniref:Prepilin-type N-terminal cleavage/methylation domain-containing protein n=1 Tax=Thiorhodococcus minor TaxID=57489 RepID=A0A6M0K154_9GAMM|nr:prepilin-type N-terminal cleavage/methylation domain-containing protein [Thiorhodococcus minor]NEV63496.1 hypothetical protein [Thiorhodococcus minor]